MARISWLINRILNTSLTRSANLKIFNEKLEVIQEFTCYGHTNLHDEFVYRLIENKSTGGYLSKENPNIDYFLQCISKTDAEHQQILSKIKTSEDIVFAGLIESPNKALTQKLMI